MDGVGNERVAVEPFGVASESLGVASELFGVADGWQGVAEREGRGGQDSLGKHSSYLKPTHHPFKVCSRCIAALNLNTFE